jgi:hypothetical protein
MGAVTLFWSLTSLFSESAKLVLHLLWLAPILFRALALASLSFALSNHLLIRPEGCCMRWAAGVYWFTNVSEVMSARVM